MSIFTAKLSQRLSNLPLVLLLLCILSCQWLSAGNPCSETIGDSHHYMHYHEDDLITINCSTSLSDANVSLRVYEYGEKPTLIAKSPIFNKTLKRNGDIYTFRCHLEQDFFSLRCQIKTTDKVICKEMGTLSVNIGRRVEPVTFSPNISKINLEQGDTFKIICQAPGHGTAGISYLKWYKQNSTGIYKVDDSMVKRKSEGRIDIEELTLRNVSSGVEGIYICERKTEGEPTKGSFEVIYKEPEVPYVVITPNAQPIKVLQHKDVITVTCVASRGSPRPKIVWYYSNAIKHSCIKKKNCSLEIRKPTYPRDDGKYTCVASNIEGSHRRRVTVKVLVPPIILKSLEKDSKQTIVAEANKTVKIQCVVARSNPFPTFSWFKRVGNNWTENFEKVIIMPGVSVQTNVSKLVIPPSKMTSFYSCRATNEVGSDVKNITVHWKGAHDSKPSASKKNTVLVIALSCSMMIILLILLCTYVYKRRLEKKYGLYLQPNLHFELDTKLSLQEQTHRMPYDPKWEFPRDKLVMLEPIGRGAFGEVWLAKAQGILDFKAQATSMSPNKKKRFSRLFSINSNYSNIAMLNASLSKVAVKTLKDNASDSEYKDLASELKILIHIGEHQNIVNLLGACTISGNLCVILEYCQFGDMSTFLRGKRDAFEPTWAKSEDGVEAMCTYFDLANFTYQISRGMDFLASKKCVHRDLAARNILVSKDLNDAYIVKVADFGMSRDVYHDGIYMKQSSGVLPLKWTAPESLADAIYTSQSDVWSYGVVLWEIFTLGGSPYPGIAADEFLSYLKSQRRMEQPETCPDEFYKLMLDCWEDEPDMRPTFSKIYERIGEIIEEFADAESTYLRLQCAASPQERDEAAAIDFTDNVFEDIQSAETIESSVRSHPTSNSKSESDYENVTVLMNSDVEEGQAAPHCEYVPMLNNHINDENDNILKTKRETRDLLL